MLLTLQTIMGQALGATYTTDNNGAGCRCYLHYRGQVVGATYMGGQALGATYTTDNNGAGCRCYLHYRQ